MSLTAKRPIRYLITNGKTTSDGFSHQCAVVLDTVRNAVMAGIEIIQIRERGLTARLLFELAQNAARITAGSSTRLLINDRFDIALAAGADGVHLTSTSMSAAVVRSRTPENFVIGVSTHTEGEVLRVRDDGADLAVYGPVFLTPEKGEPKGLEDLCSVCVAADDFPVVALGGIDADTASKVVDAGAAGFASIRYLNDFVNIKP